MESRTLSWLRSGGLSKPDSAGQAQDPPGLGPGNASQRAAGVSGGTFHIDCEGALGLNHAEMIYRFNDFALEMVEQPLAPEDLVAHAMFQESLRTPICMDESIASPLLAEMALNLKSCRFVNIKAGRAGGLTAAIPILDACRAGEVRLLGRGRGQSAIGARADLALAACTHSDYPADFFPSAANWPTTWPNRCTRSAMPATAKCASHCPPEPGLGAVPDAALLARFTVEKAEILAVHALRGYALIGRRPWVHGARAL